MRGKASVSVRCANGVGITPAYAGKSDKFPLPPPRSWDHPRVCGEKARTLIVQNEPQGSPPRMRGKVGETGAVSVTPRITPAYAGKSLDSLTVWRRFRDHPRVCGEKSAASTWPSCPRGSPPRMRGKGAHQPVRLLGRGITPAYAGKSPGSVCVASRKQDHPRVCGEKYVPYH